MRIIKFLAVGFVALCSSIGQAQVSIIPQPSSLTVNAGKFVFNGKTVIGISSEQGRNAANFLAGYLKKFYGLKIAIKGYNEAGTNVIFLGIDEDGSHSKEGYKLIVNELGMEAKANTGAGLFYAVQSIIQLLPTSGASGLADGVPSVSIVDTPAFGYRGVMLDAGRHFWPVEYVKEFIDYLALHKINNFHWHLTEDQGWRIEIKKYPLLTRVGSKRNGTIIGRYPGKGNDNKEDGGFYTQKEVKEVVAYAAERFINVVPEIEMPGHASAAIAAYPWLSCFPKEKTVIPDNMISEKTKQGQAAGGIKYVQETWGVFNDVYCAGNDSTFRFVEDVLNEVVKLFPSKIFHIGGDECPKENWKRCPSCQHRMASLGLKDEHELQSYFIQRVEKLLAAHGKSLIGWDEILEGGLAPNAMVMSWRGEKGGIEAANQGHYVIMTPNSHFYMDHKQRRNEDSVTIGGYSPLQRVYSYHPIPNAISHDKRGYILGAQANLWTEYVGNTAKLEYMLFPRMAALSEVLWTIPEKKSWENFRQRINTQEQRYQLWKINYAREVEDEPFPAK